jgi:hypothetical protein
MMLVVRLCLGLCLALVPQLSFAATAIGKVERIQGPCQGTADGAIHDLAQGAAVFANEVVTTGPDARLALRFDDGTVLTIGEKARLSLDEFVFRPAGESRLHFAVVGALRFVSGKLADGATREASVTTAVATIGVRGTDFWGGPIDGQFGVVLLEGAIVISAGGKNVEVIEARQGVDIPGAGAPPGQIENWTREKIDRAIATVAFR